MATLRRTVAVGLWLLSMSSCNLVQQNRRAHLASRVMQAEPDATDSHRKRKLYTSREAAAGGDGKPAGGGCGCE